MTEKENKVDKETAEKWVENWLDAMGIEIDIAELEADDVDEFNQLKGKIVKSVVSGNVTFNEDSEIIYTPRRQKSKKCGDPITFREVTGVALMAQDQRKSGQDMAKAFNILASITGGHASWFSNMAKTDLTICLAIMRLLMAE